MTGILGLDENIERFGKFDMIWNMKSLGDLKQYLKTYEKLPSYKKLLNSMVKFSDMYRQLSASPKKSFYVKGYKDMIEEENFYRAQKRAQIYMNRRKLIKAVDYAGEKRIVVTSSGKKVFYEDYPLAKLRKKKWDNFWTLVMYDFPEKERDKRNRLRRNLTYLDFGSPQLSIFISPLPLQKPIQKLIESENFQQYVWVARAKGVLGKSNREIVRDSWPVDLLNDLHRRLYETFPRIEKDDSLVIFWKACFLALDSQDPYLPSELLPEPWWGIRCKKLFSKASHVGILRSIFAKF